MSRATLDKKPTACKAAVLLKRWESLVDPRDGQFHMSSCLGHEMPRYLVKHYFGCIHEGVFG